MGKCEEDKMAFRDVLTKEWFEKYISNGLTARMIAAECGCCLETVKTYFRATGIASPRGFWSKPGAKVGRPKGFKHTEEWKREASKRNAGNRNPFWGKKHSDATKEKMRANHADFTGDANPYRQALIRDPSKRDEARARTERRWLGMNRIAASQRSRKGQGKISGSFWAHIKCNARARGLAFDITIQDALDLFRQQEGLCALSGTILILDERDGERTASLDRIDSGEGYTLDNIQWLHKDVNLAKRCLLNSEFVAMCSLIALTQNAA